jgi:hypothetical protein
MSESAVIAMHEELIAEHGGATAIRDSGLLCASLASAKHLFTFELSWLWKNQDSRLLLLRGLKATLPSGSQSPGCRETLPRALSHRNVVSCFL